MAAARGCSSIYVSPAGEVETVGIAAQMLYMRRLLADELHLSIDMLQVGKFKGAEEPLTRDGPSPEARASLTGVLVDMRAAWMETITKARPRPSIGDAIEDGPYSPPRAKDIDRTLRTVEKDDDVKALVVRIDSPGGSALASDLIWHHLMRVRKKKPVIFSVGDMAASGGMYLASAADFIFAEPMSIVGSI